MSTFDTPISHPHSNPRPYATRKVPLTPSHLQPEHHQKPTVPPYEPMKEPKRVHFVVVLLLFCFVCLVLLLVWFVLFFVDFVWLCLTLCLLWVVLVWDRVWNEGWYGWVLFLFGKIRLNCVFFQFVPSCFLFCNICLNWCFLCGYNFLLCLVFFKKVWMLVWCKFSIGRWGVVNVFVFVL